MFSVVPAAMSSIILVAIPKAGVSALVKGVIIPAPSREKAACTFETAPSKVWPIIWAAPPIPFSIAFWSSGKPIFPADTRFLISSVDTFIVSAKS